VIEFLVLLLLVLLCLGVIFFTASKFKEAKQAFSKALKPMSNLGKNLKNYPFVEGEIMGIEVNQYESSGKEMFRAITTFSYSVNDQQYEINNKDFMHGANDKGLVLDDVSDFPKGTKVQVHYNPENPAEGFLKKDIESLLRFSQLFSEPEEKPNEIHQVKCIGCGARVSSNDKECRYCKAPLD